jgi:hypothetical protein
MASKAAILVVVCLIVGLIVGFGAGALMVKPVTVTSVTTEVRPTTLTKTETFTEHHTETQMLTITKTQTIREITTAYETKEVTMTATTTIISVATLPITYCKIGEECEDGGIVIIVHSIERRRSLGIFKPGEGNDFLVLDITIKNQLKTTEFSYSQLSMTVKDENGKIYPSSPAIAAVSGALPGGGTLQPGESVRGYVCFEVPITSQVFVFRYSDWTRVITIALR